MISFWERLGGMLPLRGRGPQPKSEVDEGAETLPTDSFNDLECFVFAIGAHYFNELRSKALLSQHRFGRAKVGQSICSAAGESGLRL
jgi:hypothetical protein